MATPFVAPPSLAAIPTKSGTAPEAISTTSAPETAKPARLTPAAVTPNPLRAPQENVASALRKKAALANLAVASAGRDEFSTPPPQSSAASQQPSKFKTPLRPTSEVAGRKGGAAGVDASIKRAVSAQNIAVTAGGGAAEPQASGPGGGLTTTAAGGKTAPAPARSISTVKRTASSQNVSGMGGNGGGGGPGGRGGSTSGGTRANAAAMAYNAELLANFEKEKKVLYERISELIQVAETRRVETEKLKYELKNLRESTPSANAAAALRDELDALRTENARLRDRLVGLNVSTDEHFTDAEKLALLQSRAAGVSAASVGSTDFHGPGSGFPGSEFPCSEFRSVGAGTGSGESSSAAARPHSDAGSRGIELDFDIAEATTTGPGGAGGVGGTAMSLSGGGFSLDVNWDRGSNKSSEGGQSEVSVACLQDRILQMEETHYSTSEELQATLQELTDLQDTVNELSSENDRLADEKYVLLESLCAQTEKLENARLQIEHLKALLLRDLESGQTSDNERQLVGLLRGVEEEREELLLKQVELSNAVRVIDLDRQQLQGVVTALRDRVLTQDTRAETLLADKRSSEALLASILQREELRAAPPHPPGGDDSPRGFPENGTAGAEGGGEKNGGGGESATVVSTLRQQLEETERELTLFRAQARAQTSALEQRVQEAESERARALEDADAAREAAERLENACEQLADERTTNTLVVASLESELRMARQKVATLDAELREVGLRYVSAQDEWRQFRADLQTAVVVANEIKTEAERDMESILAENQELQDRLSALRKELDGSRHEVERLKQAQQRAMEPPPLVNRDDIRGKVISTVDRELAVRRQGRDLLGVAGGAGGMGGGLGGGNSSLSVRHLITSIEEQVKNERVPASPPQLSSQTSQLDSPDSACQSGASPSLSGGALFPPGLLPAGGGLFPPSISSATSKSPPSKGLFASTAMLSSNGKGLVSVDSVGVRLSPVGATAVPLRHSPGGVTGHRHTIADTGVSSAVSDDTKHAAASAKAATVTSATALAGAACGKESAAGESGRRPLAGILTNKAATRRKTSLGIGSETMDKSPDKSPGGSYAGGVYPVGGNHSGKTDPLALLSKQLGGSKRNALLKWCQNKTATYTGIDITNFSSSWNDGLAFCALLHTYLPDTIPYRDLRAHDKSKNFALAFKAAESVGISSSLDVKEMIATERPDWQAVMAYVTSIYKHFEIDNQLAS